MNFQRWLVGILLMVMGTIIVPASSGMDLSSPMSYLAAVGPLGLLLLAGLGPVFLLLAPVCVFLVPFYAQRGKWWVPVLVGWLVLGGISIKYVTLLVFSRT